MNAGCQSDGSVSSFLHLEVACGRLPARCPLGTTRPRQCPGLDEKCKLQRNEKMQPNCKLALDALSVQEASQIAELWGVLCNSCNRAPRWLLLCEAKRSGPEDPIGMGPRFC